MPASFRSYHLFSVLPRLDFAEWRKQLGIGIPIGATFFCEQSIFGAVALFMTAYGTAVVAAHQAAMSFTTVIYMIPLSVSIALTILVGYEVGAKRMGDAAAYIRLGRVLTFAFEGSLALLFLTIRGPIASLFTTSPDVYELLVGFLLYAVFLQFADSLNAPLQGALRLQGRPRAVLPCDAHELGHRPAALLRRGACGRPRAVWLLGQPHRRRPRRRRVSAPAAAAGAVPPFQPPSLRGGRAA